MPTLGGAPPTLVMSVLEEDYRAGTGAAFVGVFAVVLVNLAVDLTYAFLNPRIRVA